MPYRWIFAGCFAVAVVFMAWPFAAWQLKNETPLAISVIDKTVPVEDYREHLGLFWILEYAKIVKPEGGWYRADIDYYGNHPKDGTANRNLSYAESPDMIYIADTYGVYRADLGIGNPSGERSEILYGGLSSYEWDQAMQAKSSRTTFIMEFNSIASPTPERVRRNVEKSMGFAWTGWIGRYFPDVQSEEVPGWLRSNYETQSGAEWSTLRGEAVAFVDETDRVVLLQDDDFAGKVRFEWTADGLLRYPGAKNSEYGYWFDVIVPSERLDVEAVYTLDLTETGAAMLTAVGIPLDFPAVMHDTDRKHYYFAGDYADIGVKYFARWSLPSIFFLIVSWIRADEQFYWKSYVPMMETILKNAAEARGKENDPSAE